MKNTLLLIITVATITFGGLHLSNRMKVSNLQEVSVQSYESCIRVNNSFLTQQECKYENILVKIRDANKITFSTIFTTTGELIDLNNGKTINLDLSKLSKYELDVYLTKNNFESSRDNINKDENLKYAIYLIYALISYLIIFYLIPFSWYFLLQRVKEVSDVIKK